MALKMKKTERGFALCEFVDRYGEACSIQKSSLATEDCIWLGTNSVGVSRMHLTRKQVEDLLPLLIRFVESGELTD